MFKGLGDLANLGNVFKQAQEMGGRMQEMSAQLKTQRVTGSAGGGMVQVEADGLGTILKVTIEPTLVDKGDRETIEILLPAATNQAISKAKQLHADSLKSLTGGIGLPGLDEALSKLMGDAAGDDITIGSNDDDTSDDNPRPNP